MAAARIEGIWMRSFEIRTPGSTAMVDITDQVAGEVGQIGVGEGAVVVFCPHTTAGVYVNEGADPDVGRDLLDGLAALAPQDRSWRHAEGNSPAHLKAVMTGCSVTVPIVAGRLALGQWQRIFLAEFDGPRTRRVQVQALRSEP
jgi:secondary thiamine-phosphate synthase enzyme